MTDAPEFEDAADELYGLHPDRFVPRRAELVKAAKAVKDKATATAIGALRKPSLGAWLANVLARESPDEVGALEELGGQRHMWDTPTAVSQSSCAGDPQAQVLTASRDDHDRAQPGGARKRAARAEEGAARETRRRVADAERGRRQGPRRGQR